MYSKKDKNKVIIWLLLLREEAIKKRHDTSTLDNYLKNLINKL